jgi:hypothetical protein
MRRLYEHVFDAQITLRREHYDGLSKKQRDRVKGRITNGWDKKRREEVRAELGG